MSESTRKPGGHLKNMALTAAGTLGSRVLGLGRDQLIAAFFGTGGAAAAFILAFQIPNLFRRLLGEGALTTALVPVLSHERKLGGEARAFVFLNEVLRRVFPWMIGLAVAGIAFALALGFGWPAIVAAAGGDATKADGSYQQLAAWLTAVCMPYMPLICLAAVVTAALNMLGRFGLTALSAVWLNVSMIGSLLIGVIVCDSDTGRVYWLCAGAILGGALQFGVPLLGLRRLGWRRSLRTPACSPEAWSELKLIFLPAVVGAGVQQINLFLTRFLAFTVDERALSVYYYANRLVELPVGVFSVTVSTVIFPALAMHAAHGDKKGLAHDLGHGLRLIFAINIAAAAGLIALAEPIVRALFQYGKFGPQDTAQTIPVLTVFALTIPFYAAIALFGRALSAMRDTRCQTRLAWRVLALNAVAAPLFGYWLGAPGLALANLLAAVYQAGALLREIRRRDEHLAAERVLRPFAQCVAAAATMAFLAYSGWFLADTLLPGTRRAAFAALLVLIPTCSGVYFLLLRAMRYPETEELLGFVRKGFAKLGLR